MEIENLSAEKYVLLTTFRRNGDPVPTPVWVAGDGARLLVWSERKAGKVKRIRANPRVEVVGCDVRGKQTHGPVLHGTAHLLDDDGTEQARRAIARKYGVIGRVTMFFSRLRGGPRRTVGIAVTSAS
jgi:PPOX class probable F420-dependent enzyme